MSISLPTGKNRTVDISDNRLERLQTQDDRAMATARGFMDKIKDFFRSMQGLTTKQDLLNELYDLVHPTTSQEKKYKLLKKLKICLIQLFAMDLNTKKTTIQE